MSGAGPRPGTGVVPPIAGLSTFMQTNRAPERRHSERRNCGRRKSGGEGENHVAEARTARIIPAETKA